MRGSKWNDVRWLDVNRLQFKSVYNLLQLNFWRFIERSGGNENKKRLLLAREKSKVVQREKKNVSKSSKQH